MTTCTNCGTSNVDGARFCARCGTQLTAPTPSPESWRNEPEVKEPADMFADTGAASSGYTPPSSYPVYNPPATGSGYEQQRYGQTNFGGAGQSDIHPAIPALISFFLPGIGLLFVPGKVGLALTIFIGSIVLYFGLTIVLTIFAAITLGIGSCLFFAMPLINIAAAIHSYDEAAKNSGGRYAPLFFKN